MRMNWIGTGAGLLLVVMGGGAESAMAGHNHPLKADKYSVPLVRAYSECTGPNDTKPAPLGLLGDVCSTPGSHPAASQYKFGSKGVGSLELKRGKFRCQESDTCVDLFDPTDVLTTIKLTDVRTAENVPYTGSGFGGGSIKMRITDRWTGSGNSGTQEAIEFPLVQPPGHGCLSGRCTIKSSFRTMFPGALASDKDMNIELGAGSGLPGGDSIAIDDPAGNTFATPGLYLP